MSDSAQEDQVRRYYDRNTGIFLRFARAFQSNAIHQPLYEHPGMSLDEALHTAHRLLAEYTPTHSESFTVLDLGCGVGATLLYLAHQRAYKRALLYGLTLSGQQAKMAQRGIEEAGLQTRIRIWEGSFQSIPVDIPDADLAYAIEAFIHSPDPAVFFREVSQKLKPNGILVIIDDCLVSEKNMGENRRILEDLNTGYLAQTVLTPAQVGKLAAACGLEELVSKDLTPMLKLNRIQDKLVRLSVPIARVFKMYSEYCRFLVGGDARQRALKNGILSYRLMAFKKVD